MLGVGSAAKLKRSMRVGSKVTSTAMHNAESISLGMNKKMLRMPEYHVQKRSPVRTARRSSYAGLRSEKPTHLITNDSGYMNPTHHRARNTPKRRPAVVMNTTASSMVYNGRSRSTFNDFRLDTSGRSSLSILHEMVK